MIINPYYKTNKERGTEIGFISEGAERIRIFRDEKQNVYAVIPAYAGDGKNLSSQKAIIPFHEIPIRVKLNQRDKHLFENIRLHLNDAQIIDPIWIKKRQDPVDWNLGFPNKSLKDEAIKLKEDSEEVLLFLYGKMMDKFLPSITKRTGYDILKELYETNINKQVEMYYKIIEAASIQQRIPSSRMSNMIRNLAITSYPSIGFAFNLNFKSGYLTRRFHYLKKHSKLVKEMSKHHNSEISVAAMKNYSASNIAISSSKFYKSKIRNILNSDDLFKPEKHKDNIAQIRLYNGKLGHSLDGWRYPVCKLKSSKSEKDIIENLYAIPDLTREMYKSAIAYKSAEKTSSVFFINKNEEINNIDEYDYSESLSLGRYISTYA